MKIVPSDTTTYYKERTKEKTKETPSKIDKITVNEIRDFPVELLQKFFEYLDLKSLINLESTCQFFLKERKTELRWKQLRKEAHYYYPWASWKQKARTHRCTLLQNLQHRSLYALSSLIHQTINHMLYLPFKQPIIIPEHLIEELAEENKALVAKFPELIDRKEIETASFIITDNTVSSINSEKLIKYSELLVENGIPKNVIEAINIEAVRQKVSQSPLSNVIDTTYAKSLKQECYYLQQYYPEVGSFVTECIRSMTGEQINMKNCADLISLEQKSLLKTGELILRCFLEAKVNGLESFQTPPLQMQLPGMQVLFNIQANIIQPSQAQVCASSAIMHQGMLAASIFWRLFPLEKRLQHAASIYQLASASFIQDDELIANLVEKINKQELERIITKKANDQTCIIEKLEIMNKESYENKIKILKIKKEFNDKKIDESFYEQQSKKYYKIQENTLNKFYNLLKILEKENRKIPIINFYGAFFLHSIFSEKKIDKIHPIELFLIKELTKEHLYPSKNENYALLKMELFEIILNQNCKADDILELVPYKISPSLNESLNTLINKNLLSKQKIKKIKESIIYIQLFEIESFVNVILKKQSSKYEAHTELNSLFQEYMSIFKDSEKLTTPGREEIRHLEIALDFSCFILSDKNHKKPIIDDNFISDIARLANRYKNWIEDHLDENDSMYYDDAFLIEANNFCISLLFLSQYIDLSKIMNPKDMLSMFNSSLEWLNKTENEESNPFATIKEMPLLTFGKNFNLTISKQWILDKIKELSAIEK